MKQSRCGLPDIETSDDDDDDGDAVRRRKKRYDAGRNGSQANKRLEIG